MLEVSPVQISQSFGAMIAVNPLGAVKVCNFDCLYCNLGPSTVRLSRLKHDIEFPPVARLVESVGKVLAEEAKNGRTVDTIVLSGNGEPTLYPDLPALVTGLLDIRRALMPKIKLAILTNGDRLEDRDIADTLNRLDERIVKLDVGSERLFKQVNRPLSRSTLEKIMSGANNLVDLSVQCAILGGRHSLLSETSTTVLDEWLEAVAMLKPKRVLLHAAAQPMADSRAQEPQADDVHKIAHWLERKLKLKAQIEYGSAA